MEKLIPQLYRNYGVYVCTGKMLPLIQDGCIPIWRRLLLSAHLIAKNEYVKTAQVFGYCIGNFHPHTDAIEKTSEILVHNNFLDGHGNWGCRLGTQVHHCAASRYTEIRMNKFIEEIAFKYVNDVPWEADDLQPEPIALPTMIPLCLFTKYQCGWMAFGFRTDIPNYKLSDLIKRLLFLLKRGEKIIIKPNILNCSILSNKSDLEKILTEPGKHVISIQGKYEKNSINHKIIIKGWNPDTSFTSLFNKIDRYKKWNIISDGDVSFTDESSGKSGTSISFDVSRAKKKDEVFQKLCEAIDKSLYENIFFNIYVSDLNKGIRNVSVDEMLLECYDYFKIAVINYYKREISDIKNLIKEHKIIEKLKPYINKFTEEKYADVNDILIHISDAIEEPVEIISYIIDKYRIRKILTLSTDTKELESKLSSFENDIKNIDEVIIEKYKNLLNQVEKFENK